MGLKNRRKSADKPVIILQDRLVENNIYEETAIKLEAARIASQLLSNRILMNSTLSLDDIEKRYPDLYDIVLKQLKK